MHPRRLHPGLHMFAISFATPPLYSATTFTPGIAAAPFAAAAAAAAAAAVPSPSPPSPLRRLHPHRRHHLHHPPPHTLALTTVATALTSSAAT